MLLCAFACLPKHESCACLTCTIILGTTQRQCDCLAKTVSSPPSSAGCTMYIALTSQGLGKSDMSMCHSLLSSNGFPPSRHFFKASSVTPSCSLNVTLWPRTASCKKVQTVGRHRPDYTGLTTTLSMWHVCQTPRLSCPNATRSIDWH